jgi:hypothetical protein
MKKKTKSLPKLKKKKLKAAKRSKKAEAKNTADSVESAVQMIAEGASLLGWSISFKGSGGEDAQVEYIIIGTSKQCDRITEMLETLDAVDDAFKQDEVGEEDEDL